MDLDRIRQVSMLILPFFGFWAHWKFVNFVWSKLDGYCRSVNLLISFSMTLTLFVLFVKQVVEFFGVPDVFRLFSSYVLAYGQTLQVFSQFTFSLDRLLNVNAEKFTNSSKYVILFVFWNVFLHVLSIICSIQSTQPNGVTAPTNIWLPILISLIVSCVPLEFLNMFLFKTKYETTKGKNLSRRFELAMSYELSRCFVYSSLLTALYWIVVFLLLTLVCTGIFDFSMISFSKNFRLTQCLECLFFPLIIFMNHRSYRLSIPVIGRLMKSNKIAAEQGDGQVYSLYGKRMKNVESQNEHFFGLRNAWS